MTTRLFSSIAAFLLGFHSPALGQESTLQIRAVLNDPSRPDARFFVGKAGEPKAPLKLADEGLTESQKVSTEEGMLNIFTSATVDNINPKASLAGSVRVPAGSTSLIVIILPKSGGEPAYQMVVVADDSKSFPWGESRALNLTLVDFALEVGDQKVLLPGGKITNVPKVTKVDEFNRAQTNFYYKQLDQWVVAAERQMQYLETLRRIFLIYKAPNALAPDVRTLIDQPPAVFDEKR